MPGQSCRSNQKKAVCLEASEIISELVSSVRLQDKILKETDILKGRGCCANGRAVPYYQRALVRISTWQSGRLLLHQMSFVRIPQTAKKWIAIHKRKNGILGSLVQKYNQCDKIPQNT